MIIFQLISWGTCETLVNALLDNTDSTRTIFAKGSFLKDFAFDVEISDSDFVFDAEISDLDFSFEVEICVSDLAFDVVDCMASDLHLFVIVMKFL